MAGVHIYDGMGSDLFVSHVYEERPRSPLFPTAAHVALPSYAEAPISYQRRDGNGHAARDRSMHAMLTSLKVRIELGKVPDMATAEHRACVAFKQLNDVPGQRIVGSRELSGLAGELLKDRHIKRAEGERPFAVMTGDNTSVPSALFTIKPSGREDKPITLSAHELIIPDVSGTWNEEQETCAKDVVRRLNRAIDPRVHRSSDPPSAHAVPRG